MRLISINEFVDTYFSQQSRPSTRAVRNWCRDDKLPAKQIGGQWFIDAEAFEADDDADMMQRILAA